MSMNTNYYVIAGYDLTKYKTDKFHDWKWEEANEKFFCYKSKGHVQLFYDSICGTYLYLGYIFAAGDEYGFESQKIDLIDINQMNLKVRVTLKHLQEVGVITNDIDINELDYQMIAFREYT